jgi:LytS/YehU family sensor histidine kinase
LSLQKSDRTPESILQLSELMRYVIYNGQEQQVTIRQEINYIQDYMQLQQLRLQKKVDLRFDQEIADENRAIPPMLLIIFVENAFKHGIESAEQEAFLHLLIRSDAHQLYFSCENSFEPSEITTKGIGLQNLERRLNLLYPGRYLLKTAVSNQVFKAELTLTFS